MGVKLYDGCWGVTRARQVVGPFGRNVNGDYLFGGYVYSEHGVFLRWADGGLDIVRAFKSESAARAWLNRKPLHRRVWAAISKHFWLFFGGPYSPMEKGLLWVAGAALCAALLLTACTAPTRAYPHDPRCNEDGVHTHGLFFIDTAYRAYNPCATAEPINGAIPMVCLIQKADTLYDTTWIHTTNGDSTQRPEAGR